MTDAEKLHFIRVFNGAIRKGAKSEAALLPGNEVFAAHSIGYCDVMDALLDGDVDRALAFVQDMPMRMRLAGVRA